ncbi:MAG TPA: zinc ribbon domain-containing protein [Anaerolineae bacterium]|nr:zinc ribbon domain-containing protein [Anaerolineae bacterium]
MEFLLAILVLVVALAVLAYPLYRARTQTVSVSAATLDDLLAQREGVYATLRDLELDKQLGKLDEADYKSLREKYMRRAAGILQDLDTLRGEGKGAAASAEIEKEVAALRRPLDSAGGKLPTEVGRQQTDDRRPLMERERNKSKPPSTVVRPPSQSRCPNCGRAYHAGDKFCAQCGRALS